MTKDYNKQNIEAQTDQLNRNIARMKENGFINTNDISDGYHTFEELYHHRTILFATICNMHHDYYGEVYSNNETPMIWKSKLHADGTMYDGMFIAGFETPEGSYTYHCEMEYWDIFHNTEIPKAPKWDGHISDDVTRMLSVDI